MNQNLNLVFSNNGDTSGVRVIMRDGEPWFVLADVCGILGVNNSRDVNARLDEEERHVAPIDTSAGSRNVTVVSESGLYSVILGARTSEQSRAFKHWVTREVLPTIRKTGSYDVLPVAENIPFAAVSRDPITLALEAALETRRDVIELVSRTDALEQRLDDEPLRSTEIGRIYRLGQQLGKLMGGYDKAWRIFKDRFQLASYRDLPRRDFEDGVKFLEHQIQAWGGTLFGSEGDKAA